MLVNVCILSFFSSLGHCFVNPGIGFSLPIDIQVPSLGDGGYVSSVYKVPAKDEYSGNSYSAPQSYQKHPSNSYKPSVSYQSPVTSLLPDSYITGYSNLKYERDTGHSGKPPLFYGDTFNPIEVYRDPYQYSGPPYSPTAGPASRFSASSSLVTNNPVVHSEPLLQAVHNPFDEELEFVNVDNDLEEPQPQPEPAISISNDGSEKKLAALSLDPDDPFDPEAEVDIEADFLPSTNPLASRPAFPVSQHVPVHSISQTLELLPPSYLDRIRQQREFEDNIANLREDTVGDHKQTKREQVLDQDNYTEPDARELLSEAEFNKDKIHAYNIYKNMWTTSGDKKLVVDASRALQRYHLQHSLGSKKREFSVFSRDSEDVDIDNYLRVPTQTDRDTQTQANPFSLFTISDTGVPSMPFMTTFISDMRNFMSRPIFEKSGTNMMYSLREVMHNMRNASGDNRFDIYDFVPLLAVLFATALILSGLFPNSFNVAGGSLTFGRSAEASGRRSEEDSLDTAISHLENGVLLLSAIRDGGQCSAKVACKLGQVTRDSFANTDMIVDAVSLIMPALSTAEKYSNFTESFSRVARSEDSSSCSAECSRCLVI